MYAKEGGGVYAHLKCIIMFSNDNKVWRVSFKAQSFTLRRKLVWMCFLKEKKKGGKVCIHVPDPPST